MHYEFIIALPCLILLSIGFSLRLLDRFNVIFLKRKQIFIIDIFMFIVSFIAIINFLLGRIYESS